MIRKLLIVFASGFVLSILLVGSAWVIGGSELAARLERDHDWHFGPGERHQGPTATRNLPFDGNRTLTIDAPVSLHFTRGAKSEMIVTSPARVLDTLRWENGRLAVDGKEWWGHRGLTVTITAPQIAGLSLHGPGHAELDELDQPSLRLEVRGPADVDASGKVGNLDIDSRGVGSLDLEDVDVRDARLRVKGVGNVEISASGTVDASLNGVGNITLHRKPARLNAETHGIGQIRRDYDEDTPESHGTQKP